MAGHYGETSNYIINGLDYRYVYGNDRLSVNITGVDTSSGNIVENGNQIRLYYHMNLRGTADYLTSPVSGKVTSWTHYNEWGEITYKEELNITSAYRRIYPEANYTGHDWDDVLGMYYAKARFYDPAAKRFVSMDPVKGNVTDPMSLVPYIYVVDNPLRYIDPLGECYFDSQGNWCHTAQETLGGYDLTPNPRDSVLSYGSSGFAVVHLQILLNKAGYEVERDGQFGPETQAAVLDFQRESFIREDGIVGPKTWEAFFKPNIFAQFNQDINNVVDAFENDTSIQSKTQAITHAVADTPALLRITEEGMFKGFFNFFDFYQDENGIYHTYQNCWQKLFGFNDFYDLGFSLGTDMRRAKFEFTSDGTDYIFWAWKGDYLNLGAGAELAIYYRPFRGSPHWLVSRKLSLPMTLTLIYKDGQTLFSYAPDEKQWWITGFDPKYHDVLACDLTAIYTVDFSERPQMYEDFVAAISGKDTRWTFDLENYIATLIF